MTNTEKNREAAADIRDYLNQIIAAAKDAKAELRGKDYQGLDTTLRCIERMVQGAQNTRYKLTR